jgi:D-3-phosphoglycerate dehydrogenase / 2-oxoglutarate reductase
MSSTKFRVVITDSDFSDSDLEEDMLSKIGASLEKFQTYDENEVIKFAQDADVILCDYAPVNRKVLSSLRKLRAVIEYGVGYDNIDVKAATEHGVLVCNIPDFMDTEVAEHTLALILALTRKITKADAFVKGGSWTKYGSLSWQKLMPISHLDGKVAGVIGFGRIGRQVAERLSAFKLKILAFDPYVNKEVADKMGVRLTDINTLMKESDIVSVNALLSKETFHLISEKEIRLMKPTAVIVNTARGKIIDQKYLADALRERRIAGAGLDVEEGEPPDPDAPLLKLDNVILTPHIAGVSEKAMHNLRVYSTEEAIRILREEKPKHPVNPEVLSSPPKRP